MPPITSSRPGARAMNTGFARSKKSACCRSVPVNRARSAGSDMDAVLVEVVHRGQRAKLGCGCFRRRVAEEVAAADLGTREVLERIGPAERREESDEKMVVAILAAVRWRLVQRHDVGKRLSPEIVVAHGHVLERARERLALSVR